MQLSDFADIKQLSKIGVIRSPPFSGSDSDLLGIFNTQ